jgi:hypothetical protein
MAGGTLIPAVSEENELYFLHAVRDIDPKRR